VTDGPFSHVEKGPFAFHLPIHRSTVHAKGPLRQNVISHEERGKRRKAKRISTDRAVPR